MRTYSKRSSRGSTMPAHFSLGQGCQYSAPKLTDLPLVQHTNPSIHLGLQYVKLLHLSLAQLLAGQSSNINRRTGIMKRSNTTFTSAMDKSGPATQTHTTRGLTQRHSVN